MGGGGCSGELAGSSPRAGAAAGVVVVGWRAEAAGKQGWLRLSCSGLCCYGGFTQTLAGGEGLE